MPVCDCCRRDKPDVKIRVRLRGVDNRGKNTAKPFHGSLSNDCLTRIGRFGSAEQRWLLHQIMQASAYRSNPSGEAPTWNGHTTPFLFVLSPLNPWGH